MSSLGVWFTSADDGVLVVVVPPQQEATTVDAVFSHALAWQQDRDLVLVVPKVAASPLLARLAWVEPPCRVLTYDESLRPVTAPVPARDEVLAEYAGLPERTVASCTIPPERLRWVRALVEECEALGCRRVDTANYVSWHYRGFQVLRVTDNSRGLLIAAGVQSKVPTEHHIPPFPISEKLSGAQSNKAIKVISADCGVGRTATVNQAEHRLQATLNHGPRPPLGLVNMRREYPGYRAPGREGFIDFLALDDKDHLHVVETKIGHDPQVLVQALDYKIWVEANEAAIRKSLHWPERPSGATVHLDLILAGKSAEAADGSTTTIKEPAVNAYLPGQLEALARDVQWRIYIVANPAADTVEGLDITQVRRAELWAPVPGRVAKAVCPPRWATRSVTALRERPDAAR